MLSLFVLPEVVGSMFIEAYRLPSGSMEDTLLTGDLILADRFQYGPVIPLTNIRLPAIRQPQVNDLVVFRSPGNAAVSFVERCVAVGGQTVEIRDKVVYVDGTVAPLPPHAKFLQPDKPMSRSQGPRDNFGPYLVPEGHVFVMGDNRDNSYDSRYYGSVPNDHILGRAFVVYFSIGGNHIGNMQLRLDRIGLVLK